MPRYLIVTPGYPSEEKKYNNGFVHTRVKNYQRAGLDVEVFSYDKKPFARPQYGKRYTYEGIEVEKGNIKELEKKIKVKEYDKILMHFAIKEAVKGVLLSAPNTPVIIWCHGVDVISWRRRMYNLRLANAMKFAGYSVLNTLQRIYLHYASRKFKNRLTFVFVSNWVKDIAEKDMWRSGELKNCYVIPNIVDENIFQYQQKEAVDRLKILSIRSFDSRKYANDQTVKAIALLSQRPYFKELKFTICGDGRLWNRTTAPLERYDNVTLNRRFYSHQEISELHSHHGVMLMPTRQDTHGVSTCEGMSSGLVPISSNNSAIPEYIPNDCGFLANNARELADAIDKLYYCPDKFLEYSRNAATFMRKTCAVSVVVKMELDLIMDKLGN